MHLNIEFACTKCQQNNVLPQLLILGPKKVHVALSMNCKNNSE